MASPAPVLLPAPLHDLVPCTEADRHVADLAHVLAHRMRSPLSSIQCCTEMLASEVPTAEQRDLALRILEGALLLEEMLAGLQRLCVPVHIVRRPLSPRRVLEEALAGLGEEGEAVALYVGAGEVRADPVLLRQALIILLRNALEAVSSGPAPSTSGGAVAEGPAVALRFYLEERGGGPAACFEVWNAGRLDGEAGRVFDPFYTTKSRNLGLGLPLGRRIAEAHGGSLGLFSEAGGGVRFTLRIPVGEELPSVTGLIG